ncbi:MAG TPA: tetratricopeptide repeat protein [Ignavibacteria bacterium]|nr:tetratricopeptide repeat protein [Ignavibacteria bacterium]
MKKKFSYISFIFIILYFCLFFSKNSYSQTDKVSSNEQAQGYFIAGKTAELKFNYYDALQNYQTALKYDKAAGIYFAIANLQFTLDKPADALSSINSALRISPDDITYLELKAGILRAQEKYDKAAETYEAIIRKKPDYTYGLYSLARMYQHLNKPEKAIVIYEKITDEIGYDFDVLKRMYEIYFQNKDYEKCVETLSAILKIYPFDIAYKKQLAALYVMINRPDEAEQLYTEILIIDPKDKEILTELTKIYFVKNEMDKGFEKFRKILGKDSLSYAEKIQLGEIYYNLIVQDREAITIAKNIFTNVSENYPDKWVPYYFLGAIDIVNKDFDSYTAKFEKALQLADTAKDALLQIGYVYYTQNKITEADDALAKAVRLYPEDFQANYFYGLVLQRKGDEPTAINYFEYALEINPDDVGMLSTLALAYDNQKMYDKSDEAHEKALRLDPESALILNNYAYQLSERGVKLDKALAMSKKSLQKEPKNASYLDTIGWIYYKMKQYEEARSYIMQSLQVNGGSAVVNEHMGDIYNAMGDKDNARKYWQKALDLSPGNEAIKNKLFNI